MFTNVPRGRRSGRTPNAQWGSTSISVRYLRPEIHSLETFVGSVDVTPVQENEEIGVEANFHVVQVEEEILDAERIEGHVLVEEMTIDASVVIGNVLAELNRSQYLEGLSGVVSWDWLINLSNERLIEGGVDIEEDRNKILGYFNKL